MYLLNNFSLEAHFIGPLFLSPMHKLLLPIRGIMATWDNEIIENLVVEHRHFNIFISALGVYMR